ncbi:MAG: hypothetical protein JW855_00630 [Gammaproteobacteria bacterium]|nr:hypothetical protein [Gammaproteobacteria bacterium]
MFVSDLEQTYLSNILAPQSTHNLAVVKTTRNYVQSLWDQYGKAPGIREFDERFPRILSVVNIKEPESYLDRTRHVREDERTAFAYNIKEREDDVAIVVGLLFRLLVARALDLSRRLEQENPEPLLEMHISAGPIAQFLGQEVRDVNPKIARTILNNLLAEIKQLGPVCATGVSNGLIQAMIRVDRMAEGIIQNIPGHILSKLNEQLEKGLGSFSSEQRMQLFQNWGEEENETFGEMLNTVFSKAVRDDLSQSIRRLFTVKEITDQALAGYLTNDGLSALPIPFTYRLEHFIARRQKIYGDISHYFESVSERINQFPEAQRAEWNSWREDLIKLLYRYDALRQEQPLYDARGEFLNLLGTYLERINGSELPETIPEDLSNFLEDFPLPAVNIFAAMFDLDEGHFSRMIDQVLREIPHIRRLVEQAMTLLQQRTEAEFYLASSEFIAIILYGLIVPRQEWPEDFGTILLAAIEFFRRTSEQSSSELALSRSVPQLVVNRCESKMTEDHLADVSYEYLKYLAPILGEDIYARVLRRIGIVNRDNRIFELLFRLDRDFQDEILTLMARENFINQIMAESSQDAVFEIIINGLKFIHDEEKRKEHLLSFARQSGFFGKGRVIRNVYDLKNLFAVFPKAEKRQEVVEYFARQPGFLGKEGVIRTGHDLGELLFAFPPGEKRQEVVEYFARQPGFLGKEGLIQTGHDLGELLSVFSPGEKRQEAIKYFARQPGFFGKRGVIRYVFEDKVLRRGFENFFAFRKSDLFHLIAAFPTGEKRREAIKYFICQPGFLGKEGLICDVSSLFRLLYTFPKEARLGFLKVLAEQGLILFGKEGIIQTGDDLEQLFFAFPKGEKRLKAIRYFAKQPGFLGIESPIQSWIDLLQLFPSFKKK